MGLHGVGGEKIAWCETHFYLSYYVSMWHRILHLFPAHTENSKSKQELLFKATFTSNFS